MYKLSVMTNTQLGFSTYGNQQSPALAWGSVQPGDRITTRSGNKVVVVSVERDVEAIEPVGFVCAGEYGTAIVFPREIAVHAKVAR